MDDDDLDDRLDVDALERLLDGSGDGSSGGLEAFAAMGDDHAAAARRVRRAKEDRSESGDGDATPRFGRFRLLAELGCGGQGEVWLAEDGELNRRVALKILHRGFGAHEDALLRFRREAEAASRLDHPGLCGVFDIGRSDSRAWMAMRYVEGLTLAQRLAQEKGLPTRAAIDEWTRVVEEASRAVHAAHEAGVVHRDLKPSNVVIDKDGHPVVLDFGLARLTDAGEITLTAPGAVVGTPSYMAPERLDGAAGVDRRADVYALGAILYRALTGRAPREGSTFAAVREHAFDAITPPRRLNAAVPRALEAATLAALSADLAHRYATALDLAEDLRRARLGEPVLATRPGPIARLSSWVRRNRALAFAILGLIVALILALAATRTAIREARTGAHALQQRDQAADLLALRAMLARERTLYPIEPGLVEPATRWLDEAAPLIARAPLHREARAEIRAGAGAAPDDPNPRFARREDAYFDEVLGDVLSSIDRLAAASAEVARRRDRASTVRARSLEGDQAGAWAAAAARVAAKPEYDGLVLTPQLGLVPLGPDPASGYEEFAHVETGDVPGAGPSGKRPPLDVADAVILVLLPGGSFVMGADADDPFLDKTYEIPAFPVKLAPFFLGKYELTQAQWLRMSGGPNPSYYFPGTDHGRESAPSEEITLLHPAESMSWPAAVEILARVGLMLPTEAQWEYACRAGTTTPWSAGRERSDCAGFCNVAGSESPRSRWLFDYEPAFNDRYKLHTPIGLYRPNPFGLHDMHGNVGEWCRDALLRRYADARPAPGDGLLTPRRLDGNRVIRGGSFQLDLNYCRSSARTFMPEDAPRRDLGVRVSAPLR